MHAWCTKEVPLWCGFSHLPWHSANSSASANTGCERRFNGSNSLSLGRSLTSARIAWGSRGLWFPIFKTLTIHHDIEIHLGHREIIQIIRPVLKRNSLWQRAGLHRPCKIRNFFAMGESPASCCQQMDSETSGPPWHVISKKSSNQQWYLGDTHPVIKLSTR